MQTGVFGGMEFAKYQIIIIEIVKPEWNLEHM